MGCLGLVKEEQCSGLDGNGVMDGTRTTKQALNDSFVVSLKVQFTPKLNIHIFPLTCCAINPSWIVFCVSCQVLTRDTHRGESEPKC